jgi:hypothetical protein
MGGGGIGDVAYLLRLEKTSLVTVDLGEIARKALTPKCDPDFQPNTAFVGWFPDSKRALVATVVPDVSLCSCPGSFRLSSISLEKSSVLKKYTQAESLKQFRSYLGCGLSSRAGIGCKADSTSQRK